MSNLYQHTMGDPIPEPNTEHLTRAGNHFWLATNFKTGEVWWEDCRSKASAFGAGSGKIADRVNGKLVSLAEDEKNIRIALIAIISIPTEIELANKSGLGGIDVQKTNS